MKLYDVPRSEKGTWVRILEDTDGPPASFNFKTNDEVLFHHTDGTYSYCHNKKGDIVHLKAWTEVELIDKE